MSWIKNPCRGICTSTSLGDTICKGCYRNDYDVINWNSYDNQQKIHATKRASDNRKREGKCTSH